MASVEKELREFIIKEIKDKNPKLLPDASRVADAILKVVKTKEAAKVFIQTYKDGIS